MRTTVIVASSLLCAASALVGNAQAQALPDGTAKQMVEGVCTACHPVNQITGSSGYTAAGWRELIGTMIDLSASPARDEIVQYLTANFPPNDKRAPKLVPGTAKISFKEWQVPQLGQRSRDPVQVADGSIWWAGQWGNVIGRIDPATGAMKEYALPPKAMPHTVLTDKAGNIWYTGNKNATVGKLDPATGKITEYKMPDANATDPHSAIFDSKGILWFTMQLSNMVGRLDPASGDVKVATMPTPNSRPYGIKLDAQGTPWVGCNGTNCIVKVDPATMALTEVKLPPGSTAKRLAFDSGGMIWFANAPEGRLGRYDPKTGAIKEWPSPSGPTSSPYAIAVIDDIVWYNESGMRPEPLVRFDPKTETFQSWSIPSGGVHAGIIRHMRPTKDGDLLIHQSSTNRIILVNLKGASATR